ncbi:transcriptional regulator [Fulvivirga ulvae]|uniref:winged helix-turn-helix domain-containing protein n=1 Tax=Fulvivirga ulvae TaxID=2904245 RepID=UPI001F22D50E|nr:transcriptional regulator [Fulvivirga ulvae]UII33762.1 transcriptional regulator [Fulvivirga ulvae]
MKQYLNHLNKAFENRVRLGIMSALTANDYMDFNTLKELLNVTDGNLASHLKALEKEEYVGMEKTFIGRKPNTRYHITKSGRSAFETHINALEQLIKEQHQSK